MPTDRKPTEREKEREMTLEVNRIREVEDGVWRERMLVGQAPRGNTHPSGWGIDQRPFVWVPTSKPADNKVPEPPRWTPRTDVFHAVTPLPYAPYASGLAMTEGEDEPGSKTSECSTPGLREGKVLQPKVWEPKLSGGLTTAPTLRPVFRCPQSFPASGVETLQSNPRVTFMPVNELTEARNPLDAWETSTSEEGSQRSSSWVEGLIDEECMQNVATLKCTRSSRSTYTGESSRITHHKAPKKGERASASNDVAMFESLSDTEDLPDEEGGQVVSEKRRKRMLSNRASAQRSRQRRQERLDTLEVLVAELRVENAALARRANLAALAAKKYEKENKTLRDRLGKQEPLQWSDTSNESDKTTENSDMAVSNDKNGVAERMYGGSIEPTSNHGSPSADTGGTPRNDRESRESSRPLKVYRDDDNAGAENSKTWNNPMSSSSFDFEFNSNSMEGVAGAFYGGGGASNRSGGVPEGVIARDSYQAATMVFTRPPSFQNLHSFGIELEQRNQEMDKKNLDSISVEDIWLDSLANCLK